MILFLIFFAPIFAPIGIYAQPAGAPSGPSSGPQPAAPSAPSPAPTAPQTSKAKILPNPLSNIVQGGETADLAKLIGTVIRLALGLIGIITMIVFIVGGIILLTSGGSSDKIEKGRNIIISGAIGVTLVFAAYIIVRFVTVALSNR